MLTFREITPQDRELVLPMVYDFYRSDAVDHSVDAAILEQSFQDAAGPAEPLLWGVLVQWDETPAGYLYITQCYSAEVGGRCIFLEELYLKPEFRGLGLGGQIMAWLEQTYPTARRFRLELTQVNQRAAHLYQKAGYKPLRYQQMVYDK